MPNNKPYNLTQMLKQLKKINKKKLLMLVFIPLIFTLAACTQKKEPEQEIFEPNDNDQIFCAQDVKECPNGTFVGRDPKNNCEFEPCP